MLLPTREKSVKKYDVNQLVRVADQSDKTRIVFLFFKQ